MPEEKYMLRAINLARQAEGFTNPNPMVGAVIVKNGNIIGEGFHQRYGELHAERNAFASLTESAEGATVYVTLEPCCHYGKTPPCTEAIIENKVAEVVIGSRDPNPLVSGKGVKLLEEAGIKVVQDFMRKECDEINPVFFHYITSKMPYVTVKYAMTCDGKIATKTGASKWITGEAARAEVQRMRHRNMAVMAGIGTVLADDPMLNVRIEGLKNPVRVICDSSLRISPESKIVKTAKQYRTVAACTLADGEKKKALAEAGVEVVELGGDGQVDLKRLLAYLGSCGIDSVFVEGGSALNDSLRKAKLIDRLEVFIAPKIFGGAEAKSPIGGVGVSEPADAEEFFLKEVKRFGEDILLTYVKSR